MKDAGIALLIMAVMLWAFRALEALRIDPKARMIYVSYGEPLLIAIIGVLLLIGYLLTERITVTFH